MKDYSGIHYFVNNFIPQKLYDELDLDYDIFYEEKIFKII